MFICLILACFVNNVLVVGGSNVMRKYWSSFIQDTCVLMYVVDSSDEKRLPEAFSELHTILGDERLCRVPIVIVANKQVKTDIVYVLCLNISGSLYLSQRLKSVLE